MNQKLIVQYADIDLRIVRGQPAHLIPVDHPRSELNGHWVTTSPVVAVRPGINGPIVETVYSLYQAGETDEFMGAQSKVAERT